MFNHNPSSSITFNHRQSASIIFNQLSSITFNQCQSVSIMFNIHPSSINFNHLQSSSIIVNQFQSSSVIFNHLQSILNDHFADWTTLESNMTRPGLDQHTTTNKNKGWDFHWENAQVHEEKPLAAQLRCCTLCSHCGVKWFKYAFIILYNYIARQQGPVACAADCWIGQD